jgi:alpha-beta hydrolase superfamily lysophospholipase
MHDMHGMHANRVENILLIHGPCVQPLGWEHWIERYVSRGYHVIGSALPMERSGNGCLSWYDDSREQARLTAVTDYYERIALTMPTSPILVGHCLGGSVVQLLVDRGIGAAGVAMNVPPAPNRFGSPGVRIADSDPAVDYGEPDRAPLLLVAGGRDASVPAELVATAARCYRQSVAITGYLEYPASCHHPLEAPGWEHLADDVLDWAEMHTTMLWSGALPGPELRAED